MANSSDWLGALAGPGAVSAPGWLALLGEPADFREVLPFAAPAATAAEPVPEPEPEQASAAEDALAQAYAQGEADGRAAALAEAASEAARQRALRLSFRTLDEAAQAVLAADLAETVMALCDGVIGDHAADRAALLARCETAAARIGGAVAALRLRLHPDDIDACGPEALAGWNVIADPALERGALLIEGAEGAARDGPSDWRRAIAAAVRG